MSSAKKIEKKHAVIIQRTKIRAEINKHVKAGKLKIDDVYTRVAKDKGSLIWDWITDDEERQTETGVKLWDNQRKMESLTRKKTKTAKDKSEIKKLKEELRLYTKKIAARIKLLHQDDKAKQFESNTVKFMKMMGLKDYDGTKIVDGEAKPLYLDHPAGWWL